MDTEFNVENEHKLLQSLDFSLSKSYETNRDSVSQSSRKNGGDGPSMTDIVQAVETCQQMLASLVQFIQSGKDRGLTKLLAKIRKEQRELSEEVDESKLAVKIQNMS